MRVKELLRPNKKRLMIFATLFLILPLIDPTPHYPIIFPFFGGYMILVMALSVLFPSPVSVLSYFSFPVLVALFINLVIAYLVACIYTYDGINSRRRNIIKMLVFLYFMICVFFFLLWFFGTLFTPICC